MATATRSRIRPIDVVLAPLRWLERARGWKRRLLICGYLIVGMILVFFGWWGASLNGLPDVGDPFDVDAFVEGSRPRDSDDAFVLYRRASGSLRDHPGASAADWNTMWSTVRAGWPNARPATRAWVESNRDALSTWREGTTRPGALPESLDSVRSFSRDALVDRMLWLAYAAILEGAKREAEGDRSAALDWYLAVLRSCRHQSTRSRLDWRQQASGIESLLHDRLVAWASDPKADPSDLIRAANAIAEIDARMPPISENLKVEYIALDRALGDLPRLARAIDSASASGYEYDQLGGWMRAYWFVKREPERSRRLARLFFANWLAHCDDPASSAPKIVPNSDRGPIWGLYEGRGKGAWTIDPEALFGWLESTVMLRRFVPMYPYLTPNIARERQARATLIVLIAEKAYALERGMSPASTGDLVPRYLQAIPSEYVGSDTSMPKP